MDGSVWGHAAASVVALVSGTRAWPAQASDQMAGPPSFSACPDPGLPYGSRVCFNPQPCIDMKLHQIAAAALVLTACMLPAHAANHALILTIDYAGSPNALPGIDRDGDLANKMALDMGVPEGNIRRVSNRDLSAKGIEAALRSFGQKLSRSDNVFIYYSGHGAQISRDGKACIEGMVGDDMKLLLSQDLSPLLKTIASTAARTVVMNDSCFSGGQFRDKDAATRSTGPTRVAKQVGTSSLKASTVDNYECGAAVNKQFRDMGVVAYQASNQYVYLAAASDREVAFATPTGSSATVAWSTCLRDASTDLDRNGSIDGTELRSCAQSWLRREGYNQTVVLAGSEQLPIAFLSGTTQNASTGDACRASNGRGVLESLVNGANRDVQVSLSLNNQPLRIGRDLLDFTVETGERGYLYLLHVGSSGKFHQLFPNERDDQNLIERGKHRFPRDKWAIQAQGPNPGTGQLLALVSPEPRNIAAEFSHNGTFAEMTGSCKQTKELGLISRQGRYGVSQITSIEEVK